MEINNTLLLEIITAAKKAGALLVQLQATAYKVHEVPGDFVTNADYASDTTIIEYLTHRYPGVPFLTEESGGERVAKGTCFIVDALDGTNNFMTRDEAGLWAVSIACVVDGVSRVGVVYQPSCARAFSAATSLPATMQVEGGDAKILQVSEETRLSAARIWTDWVKGDNTIVFRVIERLQRGTTLPQLRVCATMSLMQVAMGITDGYVHPGPKPEDIAAAALIVERAGGRVTDLEGRPWSPYAASLVATNGHIHDELLTLLAGV